MQIKMRMIFFRCLERFIFSKKCQHNLSVGAPDVWIRCCSTLNYQFNENSKSDSDKNPEKVNSSIHCPDCNYFNDIV